MRLRPQPRTEPCGERLLWPYVLLGTKRKSKVTYVYIYIYIYCVYIYIFVYIYTCFPCHMMSYFLCTDMYLFPLCFPQNSINHTSESTILKVVFKIALGGHAPGSTQCHITPLVLAQPLLPPCLSCYSREHYAYIIICNVQEAFEEQLRVYIDGLVEKRCVSLCDSHTDYSCDGFKKTL